MKTRIFAFLAIGTLLLALGCSDSGTDVAGPSGPTISVADGSVEEGGMIKFVVTLSEVLAVDVSFAYASTNGTAQMGSDYTGVSGTDTILAGTTADTIMVSTTDDSETESTETFTLGLGSAVNAAISDGSATGTITDNDGGGVTVLYAADVRPILINKCATAGCHGTGSSQGGLTMGLANYAQVRNILSDNGAVIVAGNASASSLYTKTTVSPPFGSRMPFGRPALSLLEQGKIQDWIDEGAQDN